MINMSGPAGRSFNDNLNRIKLEKVRMTTAKLFSYSLKEAGRRASFSKYDIKDAYKLIPAKSSDLKLQGFTWLGRYFCETQQTFGGVPSVCNFDRLGNTIATLVAVSGSVPRDKISRTLDDFQCLSPAGSEIGKIFGRNMKDICEYINVPLAPVCQKKEKAFEMETRGYVLGIGFDSVSMTWFLSKEKTDKLKKRCLECCASSHMDLLQTQKLMGSINDYCQLNGFLRFYKTEGNKFISSLKNNENLLLMVPENMKKDMMIICRAVHDSEHGLPIAGRKNFPPLSAIEFYTDAAGAKYCWVKGNFTLIDEEERGVACLAGGSLSELWQWHKMKWPKDFLGKKDTRGGRIWKKVYNFGKCRPALAIFGMPRKNCWERVDILR